MLIDTSKMTAEERQEFIQTHGVTPEFVNRLYPDDDGAFVVITDPDEINRLDEKFRLQEGEED